MAGARYQPVALGTGMPLFTDPISLKLLTTKAYDASAVLHVSEPALSWGRQRLGC